jgi:hypothetical protein
MRKPLLHHLHDYFFPHPRNNYRPHLFSDVSVLVLIFVIVVFEAGYLAQTKLVFLNTSFLASVLPGVLADLTNESRAESGVTPVTHNALLDTAAQAAANDMATNSYFAHVSPEGKTPWYWLDQAGYAYSYAGQNLAVNFTDSQNVETAWMASPTHRANIVKPQYTQVGFGTANGMYEGKETTFVVEFFATPAVKSATPANVALVKPTPLKETSTSTSRVTVLGSQTSAPVSPPASAAPAETAGWFVSLLASPLSTLEIICTILFVVIASSFTIAVFIRGRAQHPSVVIGGAFLLIFISVALLFSAVFAGPVFLSTDSQAASVVGAALY